MSDGSNDELDAVVVGGGMAGLTAATMLAQLRRTVLVVDEMYGGGRLMNLGPLSHYPGVGPAMTGPELAAQLLEAALDAGVTMLPSRVERLDRGGSWTAHTADGGDIVARAIVLATGTASNLGFAPGAESMIGRGISLCASCDGPLFAAQDVTVTGASRWLSTEAAHLAALAASVTVVTDVASSRGHSLPNLSTFGNVRVIAPARVVEVDDDSGQALRAVVTEREGGDIERISARALFVCDDSVPVVPDGVATDVLDELSGRVVTLHGAATALPGLFAAGDVRAGALSFLASAAADGVAAAIGVDDYLSVLTG